MPLFSPHGHPGRLPNENPENTTESMENVQKALQQQYRVESVGFVVPTREKQTSAGRNAAETVCLRL